jgi:hypothetical protein
MTESQQRDRVAYHEAGHAVIGAAFNVPISYATVRPDAVWAGHVLFSVKMTQIDCSAYMLLTLAGEAAELRQSPESPPLGGDQAPDRCCARTLIILDLWSSSIERLGWLKAKGPTEVDIAVALAQWREKAARHVDQHWRWIVSVAERLQELTGLTGAEIVALRPAADSTDAPLATSPISTANALYGSAA